MDESHEGVNDATNDETKPRDAETSETSPVRGTVGQQLAVFLVYTVTMAGLISSLYLILWLLELPWIASVGSNGEVTFNRPFGLFLMSPGLVVPGAVSWFAGAYARARFPRLRNSSLAMMWAFYGISFAGLSGFISHYLDGIDFEAGDNGSIAIFILLWLILIGYAVKAIYDEARDRASLWLVGFLPKWRL